MFEKLDAHFDRFPFLAGNPAEDEKITEIEEFLGFGLPASYKRFVSLYGGAIVGRYPIFGYGAAEEMGPKEASAIEITKRFRSDGWPESQNSLVVSIDHAGNPFCLKQDGKITLYDHDFGLLENTASCFTDFVLDKCLNSDNVG